MRKNIWRKLFKAAVIIAASAALFIAAFHLRYIGVGVKYVANRSALEAVKNELLSTVQYGAVFTMHNDEITSNVDTGLSKDLHSLLMRLSDIQINKVIWPDISNAGSKNPHPCEIWFWCGDSGKYIVYAASGRLSTTYDPTSADGYGYGLRSFRVGYNWFLVDTYEDRDSDYWKG